MVNYRRPGVYLEESLLINPSEVSGTTTVGAFVGVASKGILNEPLLVESWSAFVTKFGGFDPIIPPASSSIDTPVLSYLPYAAFSFFQNGGRNCYIVRSAPTGAGKGGEVAAIVVNDVDPTANPKDSFTIQARSVGTWGNNLRYALNTQSTLGTGSTAEDIFSIQVSLKNSDGKYEIVENFNGMSVTGNPAGSRRVDTVINDPYAGSRYITATAVNGANTQPDEADPTSLTGGEDPDIPTGPEMVTSATSISKVEGPITINICGYLKDASKADSATADTVWVSASVQPMGSNFPDREDIISINDSAPPRIPGQDSEDYASTIPSTLGQYGGDSYVAAYTPWIIIPDPKRSGSTITIPPAGAVMGMMARIDATIGVFRAPAGVIAGLSNAIGVQTKYTDGELGDLNFANINVIRPVVGSGICVMGGRTRKTYGADKYISARRTLIHIKESLRRSTQWAVFENNDHRLWSGLRMTADRILRPIWESGGLAGVSANEAYYITCDETTNPPSVVQAGEVRMEIGVALEYPAEFVVIRITQFDRGTLSTEVTPGF